MIDGDSFHAGYRAGYQDGAREIKRQAAQIASAPTLMSGSQPARALAAEVTRATAATQAAAADVPPVA